MCCVILAVHLASSGQTKNSCTAESSMSVPDCQKYRLKHTNEIQSKPERCISSTKCAHIKNPRLFQDLHTLTIWLLLVELFSQSTKYVSGVLRDLFWVLVKISLHSLVAFCKAVFKISPHTPDLSWDAFYSFWLRSQPQMTHPILNLEVFELFFKISVHLPPFCAISDICRLL